MSEENKQELNEAKSAEIIKVLGDTDWGADNKAQMKAVQLLKGLALSDEPASNAFMKKLSNASTSIAKSMKESMEKSDKEIVESAKANLTKTASMFL